MIQNDDIGKQIAAWLNYPVAKYTPITDREMIGDDYIYVVLEHAIVDLSMRWTWVLIYKPTMRIVDRGEGCVKNPGVLSVVDAVRTDIKKEKERMKDRAMATLEIEKWLKE